MTSVFLSGNRSLELQQSQLETVAYPSLSTEVSIIVDTHLSLRHLEGALKMSLEATLVCLLEYKENGKG